tara:strand:- start:2993 stop:3274 length:282 start_codon:yes stop_codon:yes gene_type:complete
MKGNFQKSYVAKIYKKPQCLTTKAACMGGFREILHNKPISQFLSMGEGISPPFKIKEKIIAYEISYPDDKKIDSINTGPLYIKWMGRRWYGSP